ncbi:MAG: ATP-dependent DNA helicase RecG [Gammaproteobacteria bacterium]|nr:ATP-dependent DNA helicase RecG [Gammaproteobacteria bacterium]NIM73203.1 ATP-dependent DNA helicase RecG [Gammaproteobacteria bacterium]NIN40039.1 ATP-dependent DNA helicase RecG [Gammaproteobacteria bacterium]NIO26253.1 ATP-dependent DNA helicase RecG [Gammaproteobacteria bacterium]NIO66062.1 ATP-dependent DNA helicase RecG [Gammaproteobacteria bacterium]
MAVAEKSDSVPVTALRGVGPRVAERLAALGIESLQDLLFHLPLRYEDRTRLSPIGSLRAGEEAVVCGEIQITQIQYGRRRSLICVIHDGTGRLSLRFFHFSQSQQQRLARGKRVLCFGEARRGPKGLEIVHPEYRLLAEQEQARVEDHLTPIYPSTEGLNQNNWRRLTDQALQRIASDATLADFVPAEILERHGFAPLEESLRAVHRPPPGDDPDNPHSATGRGRRRLAFDELLAHRLSLRLLRQRLDADSAVCMRSDGHLRRRFVDALPFALTGAQQRVIEEISADLERPHPMQRLVQGDVGSGKTVVAAVAALQAIEAGYQAAFMAPTELLAEQHMANFLSWLTPLDVPLAWLSGTVTARARQTALDNIQSGQPMLVVGTHALFQEQVAFENLALVIIDEQHRFGVHQRLALRDKGLRDNRRPHQLIMTATPIPRTLAMAVYADLDTSVIDELPAGRQPVETAVVPDSRRAEVVARVHAACSQGQQAYWVCTLIEDSEALEAQAAEQTHLALSEALPEMRVGLVHGRMKSAQKEKTMAAFKEGQLDLLVATTVIEVGVDVPNASLMIIENAERLGLSQLHQLRGRIGRGTRRSACVIMYQPPLSGPARQRLDALRETSDGFRIAERDLELRGPGDVLGTRQTGLMQLRIADLVRDRALLPAVSKAADEILSTRPECAEPLIRRWIGNAINYARV